MLAVLVALSVAGLVRSAGSDGPATDAERAQAVAASLRCPTCQGLSVADSDSPLATSMRDIIDEQVEAGVGNDEIVQHFVDRYGAWVLLTPRTDGLGWLVWVVPGAATLVGLIVVASVVRRRGARSSQWWAWGGGSAILAVSLAVLIATNLGERGEDDLATGNPTPPGTQESWTVDGAADDSGGAAPAGPTLPDLRAAVAEDPRNVRLRLALASFAFQTGRLEVARNQADTVLDREPRNVDALMLRGLASQPDQDPEAATALRSFLRLAPADHPAVPLVRELLGRGR